MRIIVRGGIWKNTEDEILKAAVMKYGLNQWSRIASLLVRKSAKQCKARWYEWLDPAIKKTEWTREEDEKLLHLAKLLPTQWRTIAPIVGRTPAQCLDRYEKLLDTALGKDERYDPADDPRRLRPGEIDPNPESKPARPDAIDMDEDEKEMLAEARARLANTRGKKAKRKAREKHLEEARRLAGLQKRRELKAAGIELRGKEKRQRGIDYNAEVAFEKKPAPGFYDVSEETARAKDLAQEFRPVSVADLEGGKRRKEIEESLIKRDMKRAKLQEGHDTPAMVARMNELHSSTLGRRGKMMLPAPQVSEAELEQIAAGAGATELEEQLLGAGGEATAQLLGAYQTPARFATPMRTPRMGGAGTRGQDAILAQAQVLAKLATMPTPLVGGENPELTGGAEDFGGIVPRANAAVAATPNPLAAAVTPSRMGSAGLSSVLPTPARTGSASIAGVSVAVGATPSIAGVPATPLGLVGATPGRGAGAPGATPLVGDRPIRDALGLNEADASALLDASVRGGTRGAAGAAAAMRSELRRGLGALPEPKNEYSVAVPELPEEEEVAPTLEEDASDIKARLKREAEARREAEEKKKSQVLQRQLPRPSSLAGLPKPQPVANSAGMSYRELAEQHLANEMLALLEHDAASYPVHGVGAKPGKRDRGRNPAPSQLGLPPLDPVSAVEAAAQLAEEVARVRRAMGHEATSSGSVSASSSIQVYEEAWATAMRDVLWLPAAARYGRAISATASERAAGLRAEFEATRSAMEREAHRAAKLVKKVGIVTAGLSLRSAKLAARLGELWDQLSNAHVELACFQALHEQERRVAPQRVEALVGLCNQQRKREAALQERYKLARQRRDDLAQRLASGPSPAPVPQA